MSSSGNSGESAADSSSSYELQLPDLSTWFYIFIIGFIGIWTSALLVGSQSVVPPEIAWGGYILSTLLVIGATYKDAKQMRRDVGWPRFHGGHYIALSAIPGLNLVTPLSYLLNRIEVARFSRSVLRAEVVTQLWRDPVGVAKSLYSALGVLTAVFFLTWIVFIPLASVGAETHPVIGLITLLLLMLPFLTLYYRRYADRRTRRAIDIGLRDASIRLLPVIGTTYLAIAAMFLLLIPVALVFVPLSFVFSQSAYEALFTGFLFSFLVIPLAMLLVLPLRLLPWIKAAPYILHEIGSTVRETVSENHLSAVDERDGSTILATALPTKGHTHTDVRLETDATVSMPGFFGYLPKPVSEVNVESVSSSVKTGAILFLPGAVYTTCVYAYYDLYPERALEYASMFPAENIVLVGLSYVGIPASLVRRLLEAGGLQADMLSLGFVGGLVPAILLIPTAWHFALEYEKRLYNGLKRLGNSNHLQLLWVIHIIPLFPLPAIYWWYTDRREAE